MYIVLEYVVYLVVVAVLSAVLFTTSALLIAGQQAVTQLTETSRRFAERGARLFASTAKSTELSRSMASRVH